MSVQSFDVEGIGEVDPDYESFFSAMSAWKSRDTSKLIEEMS